MGRGIFSPIRLSPAFFVQCLPTIYFAVNPIGVHSPQGSATIMDDILSICLKCGFMPGAFFPGMKCPECGDTIL
tara:strand:- start:96 stop:317 length:222 start_codon:yes stop_codon:yes gene_type:complete